MMQKRWTPSYLAKLWRKGIGFRLSVLIALILLPLAMVAGYIYHQRYQNRIQTTLQTETEMAQGLAVTFAAYIQGIHKQNLAVGDAIRILAPQKEERVTELLMTSAGHSLSVQTVSWVSPQGIVLASSSPGNTGFDLSRTPTFQEIVAGRDMVLGDVAGRGAISNIPSIALATAIRDFRGGLEGAIVAEIAQASLGLALPTHRRASEATLSLFDSHGTLAYHSGTALRLGQWRPNDPLLDRALATRQPTTGTRTAAGGNRYLSALTSVPGVGWVAAASSSRRVAFAEVRRGMVVDSILLTAVFALAFLLAYLLGRNIVAPLLRLENDARLIGAGKPVPLNDPFAPGEVASLRDSILAMAADLTKRAHELQESQELLRAVFEHVYDGIVIHDGIGNIIEVNERWLHIFGLGREDVTGLTISDISANPPPREELLKFWNHVLEGETKFFEWRSKRPNDGSELEVEVFLCPIKYRGSYVIMACVRDITERKRVAHELRMYRDELENLVRERTEDLAKAVEEIKKETAQRLATAEELRRKEQLLIQQSRLAAMGEMMANIAHQWRQPLNLLALIVQELKFSYQKGNFNEELLMAGVAKAMTVISHMSQTIDDFRNLLSPDKARVSFTAKEVIEKVLSMLQLYADVKLEAEEDCVMEGSRNEYSQVIINILANARDVFRERRTEKPTITIGIFNDNGRCVVTIADNGGGIDGAIIDRIFDPYFTTKGPDKGTGVGLFMSKTIIEKSMKGSLTVRNAGEGAEFRIEV